MHTVRSLQDRYGVSEETVLHWIRTGQLKALNVGQSPGAKKPRWRVTQAALDAFELARTQAEPVRRERRPKQAEVVQFYT
jgi:hypothetical protein